MNKKINGRIGNLGNKETMAKNLKRFLERKRLNPHEFSEIMNFKYTTVMNWIKANSYPRIDKIELMAEYFGVDKSDLIEEYSETSSTLSEINRISSQLEEPRQEKVLLYSKKQLDEQKNDNIVQLKQWTYNYYDNALSAGTGEYLTDGKQETITLPVDYDADFVAPVSGDSMEPEYHDWDYVFVELSYDLYDGDIGVFILDGDAYIKQLRIDDEGAFLHSLNPKYRDKPILPESDFRIVGKVIGRYNENDNKEN